MIILRKLLFFVFLFFALIHSHAWAEEKKSGWVDSSVKSLNDAGNNDGLQQAVGDIGEGIAKGGQHLVDKAYEYGLKNPNIPGSKVDSMVKTGVRVFVNGKVIENAAKAAPHVGWIASTAGKLDAGDRTGAAITATNGLGRTVVLGWAAGTAGTAAAGWVTGAAVVGGSVAAAPVALGFAVGVGVAVGAGIIWDSTIGYGFDVLDQNIHNDQAKELYGSTKGIAPTRKEYLEYVKKRKQEEKDKKEEEFRKKSEADDRARQDRTRENRMQEKYEEEKKRVYEAQQARERELDAQEKAQEAREKLRQKIAESRKRNLAEKAKKLLAKSHKRDKEAESKATRQRLREKIEQYKKKKYADMSSDEKHKALKNNNDAAWDELTEQLIKDLALTQEQEKKIAQLSGVISGGWSGKDKNGWKAKGSFKMRISGSGRVRGKYSGDASGALRGFINSSGRMDIKLGGGSVHGGRWSGTIQKTESGGLVGSGSWNAEGYHGGWRGSGR